MILVTGRGSSGSWQIRANQLGSAYGGKVQPNATLKDCQKADVIVVVKRLTAPLYENIRASGTPWVWDVVDFYPQPTCTAWVRSKVIHWVKSQLKRHPPNGIIWPNERMSEDCRTHLPSIVAYHHHRPDIAPNPIRKEVRRVGYEGSAGYLGQWEPLLRAECSKRGWDFVINQGVLADWDICVAFRGDAVNGYAQYHWKSNVKLSNAMGSGTPFIGPRECGYTETASPLVQWCDEVKELGAAFDALTPYQARVDVHNEFMASRITLDAVAMQVYAFLETVE